MWEGLVRLGYYWYVNIPVLGLEFIGLIPDNYSSY